MMRIVYLSLLLAGAATPTLSQTSAEIGRQLKDKWVSCVRSSNSSALISGHPSAEDAFRSCDTEEQLYLAAVAASFSDIASVSRIRLQHFTDRNSLKAELNNAIFKEMTKRMGSKQ